MRQGSSHHNGLLGNLFGHEMLVATFVDAGAVNLDGLDRPVGDASGMVADFNVGAGHHGHIAFVQIGDPVGHWGQSDGV